MYLTFKRFLFKFIFKFISLNKFYSKKEKNV